MTAYGMAGRIGVIDLSTCTALAAEFRLALPEDVLVLYSRLRLPGGEVSVESLDRMVSGQRLEEAALELADADGVAAIAFACTSGSLLHGPGFDARLCARLTEATGLSTTTTATAVVEALRHLDARTVSVGTPYDDAINDRERRFLESAGFTIPRVVGLSKGYDREIGALTADEVLDLARTAHVPGSDVLFLSCTNLPALPLVAELERELGTTVLTSNSATLWHLLRVAGVDVELEAGLGRLLAGAA
jgi:maleate isomerase